MRSGALRWRRWAVVVATCLCLGPATGAIQPAGEPLSREWRTLETPGFSVLAEGNERQVRQIAAKVEAFRNAVRQVFRAARLDALVPTTLVVFDSESSFSPFKPLSNGRRISWVGGYALLEPDVNYLVLARSRQLVQTDEIVFHEYMHYVLQRTFATLPHWYNEGVADFFGTFAGTEWDARPIIGRPNAYRMQVLRKEGLLPIRGMFVDATSTRLQRDLTTRFYATAWLMAHYFLMDPARQQGLLAILGALSSGSTVDAAVQKGLGITVDRLDQDLRNYVQRPSLPAVGVSVESDAFANLPVNQATEAEVARVHGDLLVRLGALDRADALLKKAAGRAADDDGLRTLMARLRIAQARPDEALALLAPAASPRTVASLRAEAEALSERGRYDDAADRLVRAAAIGAPTPALLYELGRAQMARAVWPEATAAFARLRVLDPRPVWDLSRAYDAYRLGYGVYVAGAARAYIAKAGWGDESSPYAAFAGYLALLRDKRREEATALLSDLAATVTGDAWPAPVVSFLQQQLPARELIARADSDRERTEARAYVGLVASAEGRRDEALEHLRWVTEEGQRTLVEYRWAVAELARLMPALPQ